MKRSFTLLILLAIAFALLPPVRHSSAQTTAFLSDDEIRMLQNELSGDRAFEHIRWLTHWHRDSGMEGYFKAADYVVKAATEAGLEDVKFVEQNLDGPAYTARAAELWIVDPVEVKLADIGEHAVYLADNSRSGDVTAELIWIGNGSADALKSIDVTGKIVLTSGSAGAAVFNAVYAKGAVGVVTFQPSESKNPLDFPDQIAWTRIPDPPQDKPGTFAFSLSPRKGDMLRRLLETKGPQDIFATGKRTNGGKVVLRAKVETELKRPGRTGFVEAWIRGTKHKGQQIVLTAHLQEEQGSANDDGSGCGSILEIGRTFAKLIREGKMKRPDRDIRFWWTDEISSEYRFFSEHPEEVKNILANLHQDMVGAKLSLGSRVQHLILAPHSRTSYLDTIFDSVGNFVILTNNGYLAASRQGGFPRPFTRPMYSTRGSRDGYNARFVPYFGSSDHMTFLDSVINKPAVAMINWDDNYIHSSDDDLWQIDQTQLKRNSFIIASMAFYLGFADETKVASLASEIFAHGITRLGNDMRVAMQIVRDGSSDPVAAWKDGSSMIEQGIQREIRALDSVRVFAGANRPAAAPIDTLIARLKSRERN